MLCMFSLHVCLCSTCFLPGAPRGPKGPWVPLELELQVVVNYCVGAGT